MSVDAGEFRAVLGHFASGVVVVAGVHGEAPVGLTCQSFFSLSLHPPLVALAPSRNSTSWPRVAASPAFCVNVLSAGQEPLARTFSNAGGDKFSGVAWAPGPTGAPHLEGALAWIDCRLEDVHDGGDHLLAVGRVVALRSAPGRPLVFYRGGYGGFEP